MAKKKPNLNKTNSSGWLDNYSEEIFINEYQQGGPIKDYRVNNQMVSDNTRNQYNTKSKQLEIENALNSKQRIAKRKENIKKSIEAQDKPLSIQNLAEQTQAIGDKFRLFPNQEDNFIDEYLNPGVMVGNVASGIGRIPLDIEQGNYGNAALSLATPLTIGALAGLGTQNTGQFVNNLINPLAGTGDLVKDKVGKLVQSNLEKESVKRFLEKPRFAIGRKEYLPETLTFDLQELGGDDFAVIMRGPDNAIEANLSLFKTSENWYKPGIISVDGRLQGNRIQDVLYQKGLDEAQKRNVVGIRSGDYLIEPEKTLKAHERFETIPLLPDATTKDKNIPVVGMLAHKNKNLYEDFFKQYEALPKEIRAKYSIKDIYTTFKDILPGSADSKAVNYNYGGEVNLYQQGGKIDSEKSTLSKLKKALSLRENLSNLNTEEGYDIPLSQIARTAIGLEGTDFSNQPMSSIAREQDALRMYLGLPSRTGAFEQTGPNKYRIRDYGQLYPKTMPSDEAVLYSNKLNTAGEMIKSPVDLTKIVELTPYADILMGTHNVVKGKDAKGEYLKYYDRFDFDPTRYANQYIDRNVNPRVGKYLKKATPILDELENIIFNPFELEDKVYYDPKTKLRSDIILQQNRQRVVPGQPVAVPAEFAYGGKVNDDNGYLISNLDNFTPKKVINSNYITTNNMAFPIEANGVVLYPNTGDYVFPTDKVIETPIMQAGGKINNDMKKKFKKYQGGGFLDYQDAYKGFGVGPNLTQDNSYYRSVVPGEIENIQAEINQPSALAGLNNVLGGIDQVASQGIGLVSNFIKQNAGGDMEGMGNFFGNQKGENYLTKDYSNFAPSMTPNMGPSGTLSNPFGGFGQGSAFSSGFSLMGSQGAPMINANIPSTPMIGPQLQAPVPFLRNGGYLRKYQDGGSMDMLPVGYPEYIHKSNVFQPHVIPVPRVHFSDDTSVFDMGVNLNDLVQMNGGGIGKYQFGGFMSQPRTFNANSQRANAQQLAAARENDFMHTKLRNDRQQYEDNKVDWGFMNWAKEPTGAYLGMMSTVPILGGTVKDVLGDSFLTRTSGYQVGQGVGKTTMGAGKIAGGIATGNVGMVGQGIGDVGEGVGSTVGNLNAKSAMADYNKSGYVSGKRLANAAKDFNTTMGLSSKLYGIGASAVDLAKNPSPQSLNTFLNNKNPYNPADREKNDLNFLLGSLIPGLGGQQGAGGFDFSQLAGIMENGGYLNNYQGGGMVLMPEDMEIPKFKKGGLTPTKARKMLHDKSYTTDKQRKYFGYISSQKKSNGGWLDSL
jgi:hypothetical protein